MTGQAAIYNITINQGADYSQVFTYKDPAGNPIDLTGFTAALQARKALNSKTPAVNLTSGSGITLGGAAGTITISMSNAQTAALVPDDYIYDLKLKNGSNYTRLFGGCLTVSGQVTQ